MFRFFRRIRKKEKEKEEELKKKDEVVEKAISEKTSIEQTNEAITTKSPSLEEGIAGSVSEESEVVDLTERYGEITKYFEEDLSLKIAREQDVDGFVSPEIFQKEVLEEKKEEPVLAIKELPPVTLEELIEGALFAAGRPVKISELVTNLGEESATIKRAMRRLARKHKKTDAIIISEIANERWLLHLNPIYEEFFVNIFPNRFYSQRELRVLTEIAYRQPITLSLLKKLITGIGPVGITDAVKKFEKQGYIVGEKQARTVSYTTTPKFAQVFGFDEDTRRLKLQMLWRLKRLIAKEGKGIELQEEVEDDFIPEEELEGTDHEDVEVGENSDSDESVETITEVETKESGN